MRKVLWGRGVALRTKDIIRGIRLASRCGKDLWAQSALSFPLDGKEVFLYEIKGFGASLGK